MFIAPIKPFFDQRRIASAFPNYKDIKPIDGKVIRHNAEINGQPFPVKFEVSDRFLVVSKRMSMFLPDFGLKLDLEYVTVLQGYIG